MRGFWKEYELYHIYGAEILLALLQSQKKVLMVLKDRNDIPEKR